MKKISFAVLLFSFFVLAGCGKTDQTVITPQAETNTEIDLSQVPSCEAEQLKNVPILKIDNLVKNCTEKKAKGRFLD